jgi:hypothetical protein
LETAKFQGKCGYYKKPEYMAKDCRMKKANQTKNQGNKGIVSKSLRPCKNCGRKYFDHKCWELPQNASNSPSDWRTRINHETVNINQDVSSDTNVELLLSTIDQEMLTRTEHRNLVC